jgi:hypothetical protein
MRNDEGQEKTLEDYLKEDEFNIEIYDELADDGIWRDVFEPKEFLDFLYTEFAFFEKNIENYLSVKNHFTKLDIKGKQKFYFLATLNDLIKAFFYTESLQGVEKKSYEIIGKLFEEAQEEVYPAKNTL